MNAPDAHSSKPAPRRLLAIFAAAFVPGMVIGWYLTNPDDADSRVAAESVRETAMPFRVEAREPRSDEPMRAPPRTPTSAEIIERFLDEADAQDMFAVPAATLGRLRPIQNGRLSPDMADLLALSPEEIEAVDRVFAETETRLKESELARVEIISASDDEVVLRIPGAPEEARQIQDAFRNGFIEVLGDADGQLFLSAMDYARWYDSNFHTFGAIDRYVSFAVDRGPGDRIGVAVEKQSEEHRTRRSGASN